MKGKTVTLFIALLLVFLTNGAKAEERYIITASDGSEIAVKSYRFTDDHVEYTTINDLPGFMKKEDFVSISNMIGVQTGERDQLPSVEELKEREIIIWIASGIALLVLYLIFMIYVTRKKKRLENAAADIYYGRIEKEPVTQGHLSFEYKELLGRKQQRTVEVTSAYEEDGTLYINGYCTVKNERKLFRADRVIGMARDMSTDHCAPIEEFFVNAED